MRRPRVGLARVWGRGMRGRGLAASGRRVGHAASTAAGRGGRRAVIDRVERLADTAGEALQRARTVAGVVAVVSRPGPLRVKSPWGREHLQRGQNRGRRRRGFPGVLLEGACRDAERSAAQAKPSGGDDMPPGSMRAPAAAERRRGMVMRRISLVTRRDVRVRGAVVPGRARSLAAVADRRSAGRRDGAWGLGAEHLARGVPMTHQ